MINRQNFFLRCLITLILYLVWFFLLSIFYLFIIGFNRDYINSLDPNYQEFITDCIGIILILFLSFFLVKKKKMIFNISKKKISSKILFVIVLTTLSFFILKSSIAVLFGEKLYISENPSIIYFIDFVVLAPLGEELLYRFYLFGFLQPSNLKSKTSEIIISVLLISLIFALGHLQIKLWLFVSHFLFSVFITTIYYKTRSLWIVFTIHSLFNLTVFFHIHYFIQELDINQNIIYLIFVASILTIIFFLKKLPIRNV